MGKDILVIDNDKPTRKKPFAFTPQVLDQIEKLASLMCTLTEIGDIIGCSHDTIQRNQEAKDAIKRGVANAKHTIRKTQFDIATKLNSSMMAIYLGRVYLKQNPNIVESEESTPLPITDIIDIEEPKNDTIPKKEI
jgi:hypothetical protein